MKAIINFLRYIIGGTILAISYLFAMIAVFGVSFASAIKRVADFILPNYTKI